MYPKNDILIRFVCNSRRSAGIANPQKKQMANMIAKSPPRAIASGFRRRVIVVGVKVGFIVSLSWRIGKFYK